MILPDFSKSRILVVGDVMLDRYLSGGTDRISPSTCASCSSTTYNRQAWWSC